MSLDTGLYKEAEPGVLTGFQKGSIRFILSQKLHLTKKGVSRADLVDALQRTERFGALSDKANKAHVNAFLRWQLGAGHVVAVEPVNADKAADTTE